MRLRAKSLRRQGRKVGVIENLGPREASGKNVRAATFFTEGY